MTRVICLIYYAVPFVGRRVEFSAGVASADSRRFRAKTRRSGGQGPIARARSVAAGAGVPEKLLVTGAINAFAYRKPVNKPRRVTEEPSNLLEILTSAEVTGLRCRGPTRRYASVSPIAIQRLLETSRLLIFDF